MSSRKAALGRGLNALLPSANEETPDEHGSGELPRSRLYNFEDRYRFVGRVADIEIEHIRPNPYQPRKNFDETALNELAASIKQLGIIQPITVRAMGNGRFEVISGERRLRAARRAGLKRIPAFVREADTEAMLEMAIVENVQREELNPIEVALGYQRLIEECRLSQQQVALKVGKSRATVTNFLRLLRLPLPAQAALRDGSISMGHARALINIDDAEAQRMLLQAIIAEQLSVRQVEERARALRQPRPSQPDAETSTSEKAASPPAPPSREALQFQAITDRLRTHLSTQVQIKRNAKGGGRIEVAYYSDEDLERLLELLIP